MHFELQSNIALFDNEFYGYKFVSSDAKEDLHPVIKIPLEQKVQKVHVPDDYVQFAHFNLFTNQIRANQLHCSREHNVSDTYSGKSKQMFYYISVERAIIEADIDTGRFCTVFNFPDNQQSGPDSQQSNLKHKCANSRLIILNYDEDNQKALLSDGESKVYVLSIAKNLGNKWSCIGSYSANTEGEAGILVSACALGEDSVQFAYSFVLNYEIYINIVSFDCSGSIESKTKQMTIKAKRVPDFISLTNEYIFSIASNVDSSESNFTQIRESHVHQQEREVNIEFSKAIRSRSWHQDCHQIVLRLTFNNTPYSKECYCYLSGSNNLHVGLKENSLSYAPDDLILHLAHSVHDCSLEQSQYGIEIKASKLVEGQHWDCLCCDQQSSGDVWTEIKYAMPTSMDTDGENISADQHSDILEIYHILGDDDCQQIERRSFAVMEKHIPLITETNGFNSLPTIFGFKSDVDCTVWKIDQLKMNKATNAFTHYATIPALNYILESKENMKFVGICKSGRYAAIADCSLHVYVYIPPVGCEAGHVGRQKVIDIDNNDEVLGMLCTEENLILLTSNFLIKVKVFLITNV